MLVELEVEEVHRILADGRFGTLQKAPRGGRGGADHLQKENYEGENSLTLRTPGASDEEIYMRTRGKASQL